MKTFSSPLDILILSIDFPSPVGKLNVTSPVFVLIFGSIFEKVNSLNFFATSFSLP